MCIFYYFFKIPSHTHDIGCYVNVYPLQFVDAEQIVWLFFFSLTRNNICLRYLHESTTRESVWCMAAVRTLLLWLTFHNHDTPYDNKLSAECEAGITRAARLIFYFIHVLILFSLYPGALFFCISHLFASAPDSRECKQMKNVR